MISLSHAYADLPDRFFVQQKPDPAPLPALVRLNETLARTLGLDLAFLSSEAGISMLAGGLVPKGAKPLSMAYAGHQFGNFVPQLGDGRAILLGEVRDAAGQWFDLHLKGSGRTPFSRGGDGKAVLGAALREYIISEAMAGLRIPTTRALAVCTTGETVWREQAEKGAVLTRVAASHVRVGTFQYFYARKDIQALKALQEFVIDRHYPDLREQKNPALALLRAVSEKQADLIARWMQVGFIHGVMNTDNMTISGETIDYGPCAFLDEYHPQKVFSSIDRQGRYGFGNQPRMAYWNLAQFAQCLVPLVDDDEKLAVGKAQETLDHFAPLFNRARLDRFAAKIGLARPSPNDQKLTEDLLSIMAANGLDFTLTFRNLDPESKTPSTSELAGWHKVWLKRLESENIEEVKATMKAANPVYIARNHRVEHALETANKGDFDAFEKLVAVLQNPFQDRDGDREFEKAPEPNEVIKATFCGT